MSALFASLIPHLLRLVFSALHVLMLTGIGVDPTPTPGPGGQYKCSVVKRRIATVEAKVHTAQGKRNGVQRQMDVLNRHVDIAVTKNKTELYRQQAILENSWVQLANSMHVHVDGAFKNLVLSTPVTDGTGVTGFLNTRFPPPASPADMIYAESIIGLRPNRYTPITERIMHEQTMWDIKFNRLVLSLTKKFAAIQKQNDRVATLAEQSDPNNVKQLSWYATKAARLQTLLDDMQNDIDRLNAQLTGDASDPDHPVPGLRSFLATCVR